MTALRTNGPEKKNCRSLIINGLYECNRIKIITFNKQLLRHFSNNYTDKDTHGKDNPTIRGLMFNRQQMTPLEGLL